MPEDALHPTRSVRIPLDELTIRASRSSGPGGQHANVTASRIEVAFDVAASDSLTDEQKRRVIARTGPVVRAIAQDARSQTRNRELALRRLEERLATALHVQRARKATKPTKGSRERRLQAKAQRGSVKRDRRRPGGGED
jgi:ribosome-associated protein